MQFRKWDPLEAGLVHVLKVSYCESYAQASACWSKYVLQKFSARWCNLDNGMVRNTAPVLEHGVNCQSCQPNYKINECLVIAGYKNTSFSCYTHAHTHGCTAHAWTHARTHTTHTHIHTQKSTYITQRQQTCRLELKIADLCWLFLAENSSLKLLLLLLRTVTAGRIWKRFVIEPPSER